MTDSDGWAKLDKSGEQRGPGREAFEVPPFARLSRAHAFGVGGDALIALALAGSLFFSVDPSAARSKVALYLVVTMVPFVAIAPLVGPAIDRFPGGRRLMIFATMVLRAVLCLLMARHLDNILLYPEAFTVLMCGKAYHVAKSALVPTLLTKKTRLVDLNSKLSLLAGVSGAAAMVPGGLLSWLGGPSWVFGLAAILFAIGAILSLRIPRTQVAVLPPDALEIAELRSLGVRFAAVAMALMRSIVGFMLFLLAFHLRDIDAHTAWFGAMIVASTIGSLSGAITVPKLRNRFREEHILVAVLSAVATVGMFVAFTGGNNAAALLSMTVGYAAGGGKLCFDSIVQRDAPDANKGRSFARFETRFQLAWVGGAIIPVIVPFRLLTVYSGYVAISLTAAFAAATYALALRDIDKGNEPPATADRLKVREGYETMSRVAAKAMARRQARVERRGLKENKKRTSND